MNTSIEDQCWSVFIVFVVFVLQAELQLAVAVETERVEVHYGDVKCRMRF